MKQMSLFLLVLLLSSCSAFIKNAKNTKIGTDDGYVEISNPQINFKSLTFGDFEFATTQKDFKKMHKEKVPFKNIVLYAKTLDPAYEYFILHNSKSKQIVSQKYIVKDTIISNNRFTLIIDKSAPKSDIEFITNNIYILE